MERSNRARTSFFIGATGRITETGLLSPWRARMYVAPVGEPLVGKLTDEQRETMQEFRAAHDGCRDAFNRYYGDT